MVHPAEQAEDEDKLLAAAKKLPLSDRVVHKNWKVRAEVHEDIRSACERALGDEDPFLEECGV